MRAEVSYAKKAAQFCYDFGTVSKPENPTYRELESLGVGKM